MNNKMRLALIVRDLRNSRLDLVANVLLEASVKVPEFGEETMSAYDFKDAVEFILKEKLSRKDLISKVKWSEHEEGVKAQLTELDKICAQAKKALTNLQVENGRVMIVATAVIAIVQ